MDTMLAQAIVDLKVPFFGENLKNKNDSQSCMFDVRKLMSSPELLRHIGKRMAYIAKMKCKGNTLISLATSGIAWGAMCSLYSGYPLLYVRIKKEIHMSNKLIEGIIPKKVKLILVDDLIFAGESKKEAIDIIKQHNLHVSDIIVIVDRQLQRKKDGLTVQDHHKVNLHSLIKMEEIVSYMRKKKYMSDRQLELLIRDYRQYERWDMPFFC